MMNILSDFLANRAVKKAMKNPSLDSSLENIKNGIISADKTGIKIENNKGESISVNWESICKIHAYKLDLFTVDLICFLLEYEVGDQTRKIEIQEEMFGFRKLSETLENQMTGILKDWYSKVALPAFETNHTVIWERPNK